MIKMKLWKYYYRRKTTSSPEMVCRCVGAFPNAFIVKRPNGNVMFVNRDKLSLSLYSEIELLENK